ncbi:MAG: PA domain-containing protein [Bacteroidota bacterium]
MRNFTLFSKILLSSLLLMGLAAIPLSTFAQGSHTLVVETGTATGEYQVLIGNFGPSFCEADTLAGDFDLVISGDTTAQACDTVTNDLTGKIALIDRGACDFSTKVFNAQVKGAIGAIVIDATVQDDLISMAAGAFADQITSPSFFISKNDGDLLKAALIDGLSGSVNRNDVVDDYDGELVYMETFDSGLNGWTVNVDVCGGAGNTEGVELWRWVAEGFATGSCGDAFIASPTRCNGAVAFESDLQDNGGNGCGGAAVGTGPCPAPHSGTLTSPMIDLTGGAAGYSLRFRQLTRQFQSQYFVEYSFDGGATFTSVPVNATIATGEFNFLEDDVVVVPLVGSIDASNVVIRFRMDAFYYFWIVDDVQIIPQAANNLRVNEFFAVPPNLQTPLSQVEPIPFLADIENIGAAEQTNTVLNVTIVDSTLANVVFSADNPYFGVPANTLIENVPFDDSFTPTEENIYVGFYSIAADSADSDDRDNFQNFIFQVTDNLFSKEVGATRTILPAAAEWEEGEPHSWAYGNSFYLPNGDGFFVEDVTFALGNADEIAGTGLVLSLYEWTEDTNNDGNMDPDERVSQGFGLYIVNGQEGVGEPISVPFPGDGEDPVALKDGATYVVMVEYFAPSAASPDVVLVAADDLDYNAQIFLSDNILGNPRYASLLGISGDLTTEPYSSVGFGRDFVPVVRMSITGDATSTRDLANIENEFAVFPNPTSEVVNLQLGLQDMADEALVRIMDVSGKTILQRDYQNVQRETMTYNVSQLPAGTYFLQVTTAEGTGTRKFNVTK